MMLVIFLNIYHTIAMNVLNSLSKHSIENQTHTVTHSMLVEKVRKWKMNAWQNRYQNKLII